MTTAPARRWSGLDRRAMLGGALAMSGCAAAPGLARESTRAGVQSPRQLQVVSASGESTTLRFWQYLPPGYGGGDQRWPVVFFLHGSGQRGEDLQQVKVHGPPKLVEQGGEFPFILISPQLALGRLWDPQALQALSLALQAELRIDAARVCVTGLSLGGHGTWNWATAYPQHLAAIAPVCGYGRPELAARMRLVPVRAYHGESDSVVPLAAQVRMVEAVRRGGGRVELIVYPGVDHNAWDRAYADAGLYDWLMAQRVSTEQTRLVKSIGASS